MTPYLAPLEDIRFVLAEIAELDRLAALPGLAEATPDVIHQVLDEAARMAETVLAPLNAPGDREGCRLANGVVTLPAGFREAYARYAAGGWTGVAADPEHGGGGLPALVNQIVDELMVSANMAFSTVPGLSHGAYHAIDLHGSAEQKALYLPKLASGDWTGTMCLTEPQCGTDLGLVRTRATPAGDGSVRLNGAKIWITAGEHDLADNIVHLVLARLPDAPAGTRGISLFVAPKFLPVPDGAGGWRPGARNGITCTGLEGKMGLAASPTCALAFDDATAWLVGEPHRGMRAMFAMMNQARLLVGIQGLGMAELAWQAARAFARERRQGRLPGQPESVGPQPIIVHGDVRRMLARIRAQVEGCRAFAVWVGQHVDIALRAPDPGPRAAADDLVALMTPVLKAHLTDIGQEAADVAIQVHGGSGYVRATGVEQYLRDARIARIYEGTNGIQALDLVGRKLPEGSGRLLRRLFHPMTAFVAETQPLAAADPVLAGILAPFANAVGRTQDVSLLLGQAAFADPIAATTAAHDYLKLLGIVTVGWMWARMALAAQRRLAAGETSPFLEAKLATARFYMTHILPEMGTHTTAILAGPDSIPEAAALQA